MVDRKPLSPGSSNHRFNHPPNPRLNYPPNQKPNSTTIFLLILQVLLLLFLIRGLTLAGLLVFPQADPQFMLTLVLLGVIYGYLMGYPGPSYRLLNLFGFQPRSFPTLGLQGSLTPGNPVSPRVKGNNHKQPGVIESMRLGILFLFLIIGWVFLNLGVAFIVQWIVPMPPEMEQIFRQLTAPEYRMETLVLAVIIYPFLEELLCRGIVQDMALVELPTSGAIILSSGFFAVMHWNLWQGVPAFLTGLLLGSITIKTGNLRLAVLFHSLYNLLVLLIQWGAQNQLYEGLEGGGSFDSTPETLLGAGVLLAVGIGMSSILVPRVLKNLSKEPGHGR